MDYNQLATVLCDADIRSVYLRFNPEVFDFTASGSPAELQFFVGGNTAFQIQLTEDNIFLTLSMLHVSVFSKESKVICWDWKSFASYVLGLTKKKLNVECAIIDLKVIESYGGIKLKSPNSLNEALIRLKNLISGGIWKEIEQIYKKIHMPLMTTVLPAVETSGIIDLEHRGMVYSHYEIDGQENGRLRCFDAFKASFLPHAMKPEKREVLKPRSQDELFMLFDFRGMEVFMLAWMSEDPLLHKLCKEKDIYSELYKVIAEKEPEGNQDRDFAKKCFLPHIYGQSAYSLSQRCGVAMDIAERMVERIGSLFPTVLSFVAKYENQLKENGFVKDIFGKRRCNFESGKEYLVRNFCIQSPAATICSEKLISLYFALKGTADISYTVHDGYVVYATKDNWKEVYKISYEVLTGDSELCPGLRLKVACRAGRNLNSLKPLMKKGE